MLKLMWMPLSLTTYCSQRDLNDIDWKAKSKTVCIRINGLDTHYMYRDVVKLWNKQANI